MSPVPASVRPRALRGEVGEDGVEMVGAAGGAGVVAGHHRQVQAQFLGQAGQVGVQVARRVLEGGEHQQFAVGPAVLVAGRMLGLAPDGLPDVVQLAVASRRDRGKFAVRRPQGCAVATQVFLPTGQVQFPQVVRVARPVDEELLVVLVRFRLDHHLAILCEHARFVAPNLFQQAVDLAEGAVQGQGQRVGGAFQPFQEVGAHHGDQKGLAVRLVEIPGLLLVRQLLPRVSSTRWSNGR